MNEYITRSIYEAAFIYANGIPLNAVTIDHKHAALFAFDNKDGMARDVSERFFADTSTPARSLFLALGHLKHQTNTARQAATR